jgi:hypothetical protein
VAVLVSRNIENVLVLQGRGSLGAFACGVFKALVKKNIRLDIVAEITTTFAFVISIFDIVSIDSTSKNKSYVCRY